MVAARAGTTIARVALAPARVFARSPFVAPILRAGERRAAAAGADALERGQRALADVPDRMRESEAVDNALDRVMESARIEQVVADALESRYAHEVAERVLESPELERAIERVLSSPAVRAGLTKQTESFADELKTGLRRRARALDERVSRTPSRGYGGVVSRGVALGVDLAVMLAVAVVVGGFFGLLAALVGELRPVWLVGALAGSGWLLLNGGYFTFFWSVTGQTPGLRLLGLRVSREGGGRIGAGRAVVRFVGLLAAIVPFFAGFVPALFDGKRRALQDWLAGTVVVDVERGLPPG